MWVKIETIPSNSFIIYLPTAFAKQINETIQVTFGVKFARAKVCFLNTLKDSGGGSFENPLAIKLSSKLAERLFIHDALIYQCKLSKKQIAIGPVIGFLLGNRRLIYSPRHMERYSNRFGIYHKIGGLIYAFSPKTINWKNLTAAGLYYDYSNSSWKYGRFPLPSVIYRRNFHINPDAVNKLLNITRGKMFNSYRFSKLELYEFLAEDDELKQHLPTTELIRNFKQVKAFLNKHQKVILKPVNLSRGRGICIIQKTGHFYKITDYRSKNITNRILTNKSLYHFFTRNKSFFNGYLIQKLLPLAKIENSLFDIRVVMHKTPQASWNCTGIECRVSKQGNLLTNIARGGFALPLQDTLRLAFPNNNDADYDLIIKGINDLSRKLCARMDLMGKHFAEFGIDIALDRNKNLWLLEINVVPSFKGFKTMDYSAYLRMRYAPLLYALSLTEFQCDTTEEE